MWDYLGIMQSTTLVSRITFIVIVYPSLTLYEEKNTSAYTYISWHLEDPKELQLNVPSGLSLYILTPIFKEISNSSLPNNTKRSS